MTIRFTILGCGNSAGVPAAGNYWGACDPAEPRNLRTRPCVALRAPATGQGEGGEEEEPERCLLIDAGPDFRSQVNAFTVRRIDAVLLTHAHGDHVNGMDDLRMFSFLQKQKIPVYATGETLDHLQGRFSWLFAGSADGFYKPILTPHVITESQFGKTLDIASFPCVIFEQDHGSCVSLGLRIGDTAYCTDMLRLGEAALESLKGIRNWIVDGAGYHWQENPAHATLEKLYALNARIGARRVILTHLPPAMDYQTLRTELPQGWEPAWDGMEIAVAP